MQQATQGDDTIQSTVDAATAIVPMVAAKIVLCAAFTQTSHKQVSENGFLSPRRTPLLLPAGALRTNDGYHAFVALEIRITCAHSGSVQQDRGYYHSHLSRHDVYTVKNSAIRPQYLETHFY